jgi:hypothetical protein
MFSFLSVWKHLLAVALLHCSVFAQATIGVEHPAVCAECKAGLAIAVEWEEASSWKHLSVL